MEELDELSSQLEDVYGSAYWAFKYGATKDSVLGEIDYAFEMHQQDLEAGRSDKPLERGSPAMGHGDS